MDNVLRLYEEQCVQVADVPKICLAIVWKPPVVLEGDTIRTIFIEGTCRLRPISEVRDEFWWTEEDVCCNCLEPCEESDSWDQMVGNCVKCTPSHLCARCRVRFGQENWCLQCLDGV